MKTFGYRRRRPKPLIPVKRNGPTDSSESETPPWDASGIRSTGTSVPGNTNQLPNNIDRFGQELVSEWKDCWDFHTRILELPDGNPHVFVAWSKVMIDRQITMEGVIAPIRAILARASKDRPPNLQQISQALSVPAQKNLPTMQSVNQSLASGQIIVYVDGATEAYGIDVAQVLGRNVNISEGEPSIQGPQAAFVEQLDVNLGQVRRILHDHRVKIRAYASGEISHTQVVLLYIDGVTKGTLVQEWERRVQNLSVDVILDSNIVRELVQDSPWTPFPVVETTERPDKVAGALSEGKLAVGVDGTPEFLIFPTIFSGLLSAGEDYYGNFTLSPLIRILRHIMFWAALTLPSIYVSLLTYNQDLLPTPLLINLESQHEGIPLPTVFEALLMQFSFEALREAGVRLPRAVGQSVSIVGALVIGEAAVTAGLVSPGMVIVVAATGVASFTIPDYSLVAAVRVLQLGFFAAAGILGLYGMVLFGIIVVLHMCSLRSFGVPYLSPLAPVDSASLKDAFLRAPFWMMKTRPKAFEPQNVTRSTTTVPPVGQRRAKKRP